MSAGRLVGHRAVAHLLARQGVEVVFSMLANTNGPWIGAGLAEGLFELVRTRHEETAVNAAVGYGRSTGRVGVCSVTRGPGFANAVNALYSAGQGHVPLVLIVAESPKSSGWSEQNIDQRGLAAVLGVGFHHVAGGDGLVAGVEAAFAAAAGEHRPQVLSLPDAVLDDEVEVPAGRPVSPAPAGPADDEQVAAAVDALADARRPLLLAGQGAVLAEARADMEGLAELVGGRLATTLRANRCFAGHPRDLGICGTWSPAVVRDELAACDVVLAVGASLNENTTAHGTIFAGARVIQCEVDDAAPFRASSPELALFGDARQTVRALCAEWQRRGLPRRELDGRVPTRDEVVDAVLGVDVGHDPARGLDPREVYAAFDAKLEDDRIVVNDSGRAMATLANLVDARDARSWLVGRGYGSVGLGLGTAIGAATAHRERRVVLFVGDGGFMMAAQDLDAVRLAGLDLLVVVLNDEQYGAEVVSLTSRGLPLDAIGQPLPDVRLLAEAFGGVGEVIRSHDELAAYTPPRRGLAVVDVRIDPAVDLAAVFA